MRKTTGLVVNEKENVPAEYRRRLRQEMYYCMRYGIDSHARRKGIGKQLIQRVMESENLESVKAQTDDDSIGFYRKCGFSEEQTIIGYPDGSAVRYNCVLKK